MRPQGKSDGQATMPDGTLRCHFGIACGQKIQCAKPAVWRSKKSPRIGWCDEHRVMSVGTMTYEDDPIKR